MENPDIMKILLWNTEWAETGTRRGTSIRSIVRDLAPVVVCLTEVTLGIIPDGGHFITATGDYGYSDHGNRRKVVLWSREPWTDIQTIGSEAMPGGRYVSGVTRGIRFTGVCIPWREAHVRTGRKDRSPWEDHRQFNQELIPVIRAQLSGNHPLCLLGDFNQRIPRKSQPVEVYAGLKEILDLGLTCISSGDVCPKQNLIDHMAVSSDIVATIDRIIPKTGEDGLRLSDHEGIVSHLRHA